MTPARKSFVLLTSLTLGLGGCSGDELAPTPRVAALVDAYATHTQDSTMYDREGREFPVRIYYNQPAAGMIDRFLSEAYIVTERNPLLVNESGNREASLHASAPVQDAADMGEPHFYLATGTAADGTESRGWRADLSVLRSRPNYPDSAEPTPIGMEDGDEGPTYSALDTDCPDGAGLCTYGFFVFNGSFDDEHDFTMNYTCEEGAIADGSCNGPPFSDGHGFARLRDGTNAPVDSELWKCEGTSIEINYNLVALGADNYDVEHAYSTGGSSLGGGEVECTE